MPGSESGNEQVAGFEEFSTKSEQAMMLGYVAVMGYFNINIDPDSRDSSSVMMNLKDRLLDTYPLAVLVQVVEKCTRHCQGRKSCLIDQVWLSKSLKQVRTKTLPQI